MISLIRPPTVIAIEGIASYKNLTEILMYLLPQKTGFRKERRDGEIDVTVSEVHREKNQVSCASPGYGVENTSYRGAVGNTESESWFAS